MTVGAEREFNQFAVTFDRRIERVQLRFGKAS
jgi:hypothetical protein